MKKRFLFLMLAMGIVAVNALNAAIVTENQARDIAGRFFNVDMPARPAAMKAKGKTAPAFYVFNNPEQLGWVIVAGDDRARPILAYSDGDYFDSTDVPDCIQDWLNGYADQIANIDDGKVEDNSYYETSIAAGNKSKIAPLIATKWAQGLPFNQQCPSVSGTYCKAGCVAIAMAQILYYYQSSFGSSAIPSYTSTSDDLTETLPALSATTFSYSLMNHWYDDASSTTNSAKAVQKLVKYCGQAVQMKYGKNSSSATSDRNPFVDYFGFDTSARMTYREDVNATTWENLIYTELANGRPVYMKARKLNGGHAFICDGYDGNGLYHINWGWRGKNNGFFALNALTDGNNGGVGAASGEEGYTIQLAVITNLKPRTSSSSTNDYNNILCTDGIETPSGTTFTRSSQNSSFNVTLKGRYWNYTTRAYTYDLGWEVFNSSGTCISDQIVISNRTINPNKVAVIEGVVNFGYGVSSGIYYLKPTCRLSSAGGPMNTLLGTGVNYVKATISGNTVTLQVVDQLSAQNLVINSVTTGSVKKVGSPLELKLGVFNNGQTDYNYIYMWVDGTLTSGTTTDVGIGKSGTVIMHHTPSTAGSHTYKFTADRAGTKELKSITVDITASTAASFTATNSGSLSASTLTVTTKLTNTGSITYNDYIVARLLKGQPNSGNTGYYDDTQSKPLYLNSGGTSTLTFEFKKLEHGERYFAIIYYYSNGALVQVGYTTNWFTINMLDINEDGAVNAADVTAVYNYILNGDITYKGYSDVNKDGAVNAADVTTLYNAILGN